MLLLIFKSLSFSLTISRKVFFLSFFSLSLLLSHVLLFSFSSTCSNITGSQISLSFSLTISHKVSYILSYFSLTLSPISLSVSLSCLSRSLFLFPLLARILQVVKFLFLFLSLSLAKFFFLSFFFSLSLLLSHRLLLSFSSTR